MERKARVKYKVDNIIYEREERHTNVNKIIDTQK